MKQLIDTHTLLWFTKAIINFLLKLTIQLNIPSQVVSPEYQT
jgi:hypothetical protein